MINAKTAPLNSESPFITMSAVPAWGLWAIPDTTKGTKGGIRAQGGDVVVARITPCLENGKIAKVPSTFGSVGGSTEFIVLRGGEAILSEYLFLWASERATHTAAINLMTGSTGRQRVSASDYGALPLLLPSNDEQRRVIDVMAALDDTINAAKRVWESAAQAMVELREGLLASTSTSESISLEEIVERVTLPVMVDDDSLYSQIGVRSHGRGVFYKEPVSGVELGSKRVFRMTPGLLVFNIVFAWEGAVSLLGPEVVGNVASHRFPTYRSRIPLGTEILDQFFRTRRGRDLLVLSSPGGAGRNKTLNQKALLRAKVDLPPLTKWPMISDALEAMTSSVEAAESHLISLRKLREELLSALLSGAHRIPETYDELMGA